MSLAGSCLKSPEGRAVAKTYRASALIARLPLAAGSPEFGVKSSAEGAGCRRFIPDRAATADLRILDASFSYEPTGNGPVLFLEFCWRFARHSASQRNARNCMRNW